MIAKVLALTALKNWDLALDGLTGFQKNLRAKRLCMVSPWKRRALLALRGSPLDVYATK